MAPIRNKKLDQLAEITDPKVPQQNPNGANVANTENWLRSSKRGIMDFNDFHARTKIQHFDHEEIPPRVVHARGSGAHGIFELHTPIPEYTKAKVLTDKSRQTPVFVRFSTVMGDRGSADTVRDVRGFATRFYTDEGNWDIVGNNIPIFFVQDGLKFPDLAHAGKGEPGMVDIPQAQTAHDNFWDWMSRVPETTSMMAWILSDRTIPRSFRMMEGFGVNTFVLVNEKEERFFVKFHWQPHLGVHQLVWDEALKINGQDPDFHRRDLYNAIEGGAYPKWELGVQIVPEADEHKFDFDLLDDTKFIPEELVPIKQIGTLTLNKNPTDFFAEAEQIAYCTSHVVPGIDYSLDPMLQIRNFSYHDTQISRLGGINWNQIPINRPVCPFAMGLLRDGASMHNIPTGRHYFPNRFDDQKPTDDIHARVEHYTLQTPDAIRTRMQEPKFLEYTKQTQLYLNSLTPVERQHVFDASIFELGRCSDMNIRKDMVARFNSISHEWAEKVAPALGVEIPPASETKPNDGETTLVSMIALSQGKTARFPPTPAGRQVALFLFDGYDAAQAAALTAALEAVGVIVMVVGNRGGDLKPANGSTGVPADFTIETGRSTLFDALIFVDGNEQYASTLKMGRTIHWVREAFGHQKTIAALGKDTVSWLAHTCLAGSHEFKSDATKPYTEKNGVICAPGLSNDETSLIGKITGLKDATGFFKALVDAMAAHRHWERDVSAIAF